MQRTIFGSCQISQDLMMNCAACSTRSAFETADLLVHRHRDRMAGLLPKMAPAGLFPKMMPPLRKVVVLLLHHNNSNNRTVPLSLMAALLLLTPRRAALPKLMLLPRKVLLSLQSGSTS
eukprot:gene36413-46801_t